MIPAVTSACARIAPTWPLDRSIAVNPLWGLVNRPFPAVARELSAEGIRLYMPRAYYRAALAEGHFDREDLAQAGGDVTALLAGLDAEVPPLPTRERVADVFGGRAFVVDAISRFCARWFDDGQASLPLAREGGLYRSWARHAATDRRPALELGVAWETVHFEADPAAAISRALARLRVPEPEQERYLWGLLLDVHGWAAWCAGRRFTARLSGGDDDALVDLLAIRLAWEEALLRLGGRDLERRWHRAMGAWPAVDAAHHDDFGPIYQLALEIGTRRRLLGGLGPPAPPPESPAAQVMFCIDVRSEVFRRALEGVAGPAVQTLGFAGFFGLPIAYTPAGGDARPQLPGLLAPRYRVVDATDGPGVRRARAAAEAWRRLRSGPLAAFAFVETLGWTSGGKLVAETLGLAAERPAAGEPRLVETIDGAPISLEQRVDLAEGMLRGMGLVRGFAPTVLLLGHGSSSRNNPHAAGLDCGACGGQRGDVNARVAAALLSAPDVRAGLRARGIDVPDTTRFFAGLHDTTTDGVTLFGDPDPTLRGWLEAAGRRARAERARRLGEPDGERLLRRGRDWAQVRPEWGLAGNAAIVFAPRSYTRSLDLEGRVFLHEYRADEDDGRVLELLLTAPMVVAHWINLQYYASTVDNPRLGSGDKNLHDVVGGHIGVFEGNGGDLRIGLPLQSLHDGERWVHTPVRLSVYVAASREAVGAVLSRHPNVRALVDNGWVALFLLEDGRVTAWEAPSAAA